MLEQKKIIVLVSNDLATDQRVQKVCNSLLALGYFPYLIGRELTSSPQMPILTYQYYRRKLFFNSGPLFYFELNIWLFMYLLFSRYEGIHANDLDTLLPAFIVSKIRGKKLVYDTHEYFTGVPELVNRPKVRKIWRFIESWIFPKLKHVFTVNESIADLYEKDYGNRPLVMRNIPERINDESVFKSRNDLNLPSDKFMIILQGSGINVQRGAEEAVLMMKYLSDALLLIVGSGDVLDLLKQLASDIQIRTKVLFLPRMPYKKMMQYTKVADLGLTLDKDTNINYRFSLPNKLFDYIHAGIPILCSDLPEVRKIVETYKIGIVAETHNPADLAEIVNDLRNNQEMINLFKTNSTEAKVILTWENEAEALKVAYQ